MLWLEHVKDWFCVFIMQVLNAMLRRRRVHAADESHLALLDPFVAHLLTGLESQNAQVR